MVWNIRLIVEQNVLLNGLLCFVKCWRYISIIVESPRNSHQPLRRCLIPNGVPVQNVAITTKIAESPHRYWKRFITDFVSSLTNHPPFHVAVHWQVIVWARIQVVVESCLAYDESLELRTRVALLELLKDASCKIVETRRYMVIGRVAKPLA